MKHLLYVSSGHPPAFTGGSSRAARFCKYAPTYGWQPVLAGLQGLPYSRFMENQPFEVPNFALPVSFLQRVRNRLSPLDVRDVMNRVRKSIDRACKEFSFDGTLVTVPSFDLLDPDLFRYIKKRVSGPLLLEFRDPPLMSMDQSVAARADIIDSALGHLGQYVDAVKCDTQALLLEVTSYFPSARTGVIPNSVDTAQYVPLRNPLPWPGRPEGVLRFVYTGVIGPYIPPSVFVPAFTLAHKLRPDGIERWRFSLYASGSEKHAGNWDHLPGLLQLNNHVPAGSLESLLCNADVLMSVNLESPSSRYMLRGKILEYLGARRPIVNASLGADAEIIKSTGSGYSPSPLDESEIASAILALDSLWQDNTPFPFGSEESCASWDAARITQQTLKLLD